MAISDFHWSMMVAGEITRVPPHRSGELEPIGQESVQRSADKMICQCIHTRSGITYHTHPSNTHLLYIIIKKREMMNTKSACVCVCVGVCV